MLFLKIIIIIINPATYPHLPKIFPGSPSRTAEPKKKGKKEWLMPFLERKK
jgi:hypothetical protein